MICNDRLSKRLEEQSFRFGRQQTFLTKMLAVSGLISTFLVFIGIYDKATYVFAERLYNPTLGWEYVGSIIAFVCYLVIFLMKFFVYYQEWSWNKDILRVKRRDIYNEVHNVS